MSDHSTAEEQAAQVPRAEEARMAAAQDPNLPQPPPDAQTLLRGAWNDLSSDKLLELVAYTNLSNWTGKLDWFKGGTQLSKPLRAITEGFCDNIVLRRLVPPEHIKRKRENDKRSQEYMYFGETCKTIRDILEHAGIRFKPDDVTGARLFAISQQPKGSRTRRIPDPEYINSDTVPHRGADAPPVAQDEWFWQHFKVTLCDANLQQVIDLVRSGAFARHGLWLNDFDVTIDCKGVVRCQDLKEFLLSKGGFFLQGHKFDADDFDGDDDGMQFKKIIMDNAHKVGLNCLSWTQHHHGRFCRVKVYIKLVQEFEKQSVRSTCGNHIDDWIEMMGTRLADARDATAEDGLTRSESTIYTDTGDIPIHKAHLYIPRTAAAMTQFAELQIDVVPASLVLKASHRRSIAAWCANVTHTLIVADLYYDRALIACAKNEITHTVSGVFVNGWKRRSKYILQRLTLGTHPIDVIYLNRGSPHQPIQQAIPGETEADKKMRAAKKQKLNAMQKRRDDDDDAIVNWVDADADGDAQRPITDFMPVGSKRAREDAAETDAGGETADAEMDAADDAGGEAVDADADHADHADQEEEEAELDAEAQVAKAVREERERAAAELAEAQAAARADTTSTVADDQFLRVAVPAGALVAFMRRYHRVAADASRPYVTEFPPSGQLAHYFKLPDDHPDAPELQPLDPNAATQAAYAQNKAVREENSRRNIQARVAVIERQLGLAGWRPTAEMNTIDVQPRVSDAAVSNKIKEYYICETTEDASMPTLDMQSVKGAQRRHSFAIKLALRRKRKEKLWLKRQEERLRSLEAAANERTVIVQNKTNTITAVEFKKYLNETYKANKGGAAALSKLPLGSYPIVAARVRTVLQEDAARAAPGIELFLRITQDDGSETVAVYRSITTVDAAFHKNAMALVHLYNSLGDDSSDIQRHGTFYMHPEHNGTPIGTLERAEDCEKAVNGKLLFNCGITIGDVTLLTTAQRAREEHAAQVPVAPTSEQSGTTTPPPLLVTDAIKRSAEDMAIAFAVSKNDQPRALRVLKMARTDYRKHKDKVLLEVQELRPDASPVVVWGGPTLNTRFKEISSNCVIVIQGVKARNQLNADIIEAAKYSWTCKLPTDRTRISVAKTGGDAAPTQIAISDVTHISIGKVKQPVVLDVDGKAWRFDKPSTLKAIELRAGLVLDTAALSLSAY